MRQYIGNRIGLAVVGGVLAGVGGYAWLRGTRISPNARILPRHVIESVSADPWSLWAVALAMVLLALITLRWLLLALGWGRYGRRNGTGTAMLCVGLKDVDGIVRGSVRLVGGSRRLRVTLTCRSATDAGEVVKRLSRDIVGRIRRDVCKNDTGAVVRLHVRK
ncbi:hypothetical protein [Thermoactinospora rubra]|uniref:hypothetical protein n=1 Tax=Thermoactinospora rubra TaxID=1088767 RepID=UPI000A105900|nr:hypothetical protein [Thermoactinospora rubra]